MTPDSAKADNAIRHAIPLFDVTLAARNLAVDINLVSGVNAKLDADTKVIDFTAGEVDFNFVTGT